MSWKNGYTSGLNTRQGEALLLPAGILLFGVLQVSVPGLLVAGLGVLALITGLTGVCPLYIPFGISTLENEKELIARFKSMAAVCQSSGNPCAGRMSGPSPQPIEEIHQQQG